MKIFRPIFTDKFDMMGSWLIQAENEQEALEIARKYFNNANLDYQSYLSPDHDSCVIGAVVEVIFENNIYIID